MLDILEEFDGLESRLNGCQVCGHRRIVEAQQNSFGNQWRKEKWQWIKNRIGI